MYPATQSRVDKHLWCFEQNGLNATVEWGFKKPQETVTCLQSAHSIAADINLKESGNLTEWFTPHIKTLSSGSLARNSFTFWDTKCFFLVLVLLAMDAARLLAAEAMFSEQARTSVIPLRAWHYSDVLSRAVQNQQRSAGSRHAVCPFRYLMHRVHASASLCKRTADERWKTLRKSRQLTASRHWR